MKLTRFTTLLFAAIFVCITVSRAQPLNSENLRNVKVDALSDDEIKTYYQRALNAGFSQDQIIRLSTERGLPAEEVAKLKVRLSSMSSSIKADTSKIQKRDTSFADNDDKEKPDQEAEKKLARRVKRDSTVFGSELFMDGGSVFEPNLRIPSPANYVLGPDDQLVVNVFGYSEQTYNLTVNAEGNVYIQNVGPVRVVGLTIEEAADKIRNKLGSTIYKAIRTGGTKVEVSLGKIRSIRVTVIGQAVKPGTYTVSSFTTLFNLLYQCGGPSDRGSYRSIEVIRGNKVIRKVDLYAFLMQGDRKDNILLEEQDVVRIPFYTIRANIDGQVKRPGKFELMPNESLDQLLTYCGGFGDSAYRASVHVTRMSDNGLTLFDVATTDFGSFTPQTGDAFFIGKGLERYLNRVTLIGAVMRPGDYELKPGMSVKQLLELAGGLRKDAFLERGIISRLKDDLTPVTVAFKIKDIMTGIDSMDLKREDVIRISSIYDLKDMAVISIEGEVRHPGTYGYSDKLTLKDLVVFAGGFTEAANPKRVEISRQIRNPDLKKSDFVQSEIITLDISNGLSADGSEIQLQPLDIVIVRPEAGYSEARSVIVEGQVLNTGKFVLTRAGERISDLIKRTGGFKGSADSSSISIKRVTNAGLSGDDRKKILERMLRINRDSLIQNPKLRDAYLKEVETLSVNVEKIRQNPGGTEDLILEDYDYINVARASNLVRVSGEVFNPTSLAYEKGHNAKFYIKHSGSFTPNARKGRVFVIYPDGRAQSVKRFLFFKSYPPITARSEVFVPSNKKEEKKGFSATEWIAMSSIIASLATMAVTIINTTK